MRFSLLFLALFSVSAWANAQETASLSPTSTRSTVEQSQPSQYQNEPQIIQGTLDNGLRYTIVPLHSQKNRIDVRMRVFAGTVDEDESQIGGAHMVEHMAFRSSAQYPQGIMAMLLEKGWKRARSYNAVTNADNTTYMFSPPNGNKDLDFTLNVLDQMLFHANINTKDLNDERQIILEEWRSGQGVGSRMNAQRSAVVRANSRYARWQVIGTAHSIETMPAENLQAFYHQWYQPNNMHLMIIGDVNPQQSIDLIKKNFAKETAKTLPIRDYHDPQLTTQRQFKQLQDSQSSVSQVAYLFRLNEAASRQQDEQGRRLRLLDRLALAIITHRLQNQKEQLLNGVSGLAIRKSEIGEKTTAVGLFASVEPTAQMQGLTQILMELERLKRYPISEKELNEEKKPIYEQLAFAEKGGKSRTFDDWVNTLNTTVFMDKPYLSQPALAKLTKPLLDQISADEVQQHILHWFQAQDQIVQYQAPRLTQIAPISEVELAQTQKKVAESEITAPIEKAILPTMELLPLSNQNENNIVQETLYSAQNVIHWQLENGDKVVWLKTPFAKDRTYFKAINSGGFMAETLSPWQSQIAVQMAAQSAPANWQIEQLVQWKKDHHVNLNLEQTATQFVVSGEVENNAIADLLRLYYATQNELIINEGVDETLEQVSKGIAQRKVQDLATIRANRLRQLRFGSEKVATLPNADELEQITAQDLNHQWQKVKSFPTTYYMVNNLAEAEMKSQVQTYLGRFQRSQAAVLKPQLPQAGELYAKVAANVEPRTDITLYVFNPHQWKGEDAALVALLKGIANNKLKAGLRDQSLGVYRLRFESTLNPETNRIESELFFGAKADKAAALAEQAKQILRNLPSSITQQELDQSKQELEQVEATRQNDPHTLLNRLILSETHYQNPSYLTESRHLTKKITLDNMKRIAKEVGDLTNITEFVVEEVKKNSLKDDQLPAK